MEGAFRPGLLETPGVRLIETMLWDGAAYPRLNAHRARLAASAARLGFAFDAGAFDAALPAPPSAARVRLTLGREGPLAEAHPLPPPARLWRLGLAGERLRSDDPWLGVKSTRRASHDRARAALPSGLDEVLLLNERGEVCEGTITNVFFDRGAGMRTPPLSCGLLPGVLRAELALPEEVLAAEDLPGVRLWVGNALRGLIPAVWVPGAG